MRSGYARAETEAARSVLEPTWRRGMLVVVLVEGVAGEIGEGEGSQRSRPETEAARRSRLESERVVWGREEDCGA